MFRYLYAAYLSLAVSASAFPFVGSTSSEGETPAAKTGGAAQLWQPEHARVIVVSLAGFEGETPGHTSFSTSDRLDDPLVALFRKRGVPPEQILYLRDEKATTAAVSAQVPAFLAHSRKDETLFFYYGSHGGYDPKTGVHTFTTYDGSMPVDWFVGQFERRFAGAQAMVFSDCCYSGGLVDFIKTRAPGHISYGALSTTGCHNVAYSGWRFTDLLIRAWSGDRAMDQDQSERVDFNELCHFAERYMAFVAEGKPIYATTGSFDPSLVLSEVSLPEKPGLGALVLVNQSGQRLKAEVVDTESGSDGEIARYRIHFTDKNRYADRTWVKPSQISQLSYAKYRKGDLVEIQDDDGFWMLGRVLDRFESMHECHFDGMSASYDQWFSPSRIRSPIADE